MPETKVVPIILRHNTKLEQLKELADGLSQYLNEKTVLVASIDFSHYLGSQEAQSNDEQTIKAIASHDINKILSYDSDKVDSPASLAVFLISMRNRSYGSYKTLWHANSGEIIGNGRPPTTSYFSLAFY